MELNIKFNLPALKAAFASAAARRLFSLGADENEKELAGNEVFESLESLLPSLQEACEEAADNLASLGCDVKFHYHADAFAIFSLAGVEVADRVFNTFIARLRA